MTREETAKILYVIQKNYGFGRNYDAASRLNIWQMAFNGYSYEQINAGLITYIRTDTTGFPPQPGQILACLDNITADEEGKLTEAEAWNVVYKAICRSGYYAAEEFAKLPETVRKAVGGAETLRMWGMSPDLSAVKREFGFTYRSILAREQWRRKAFNYTQNEKITQNRKEEIEG